MLKDVKELHELMECAQDKMRANPVIYTGCVEGSVLLEKLFDKLGISYERKFGQVRTARGEIIRHCWVETGDVVIETNPSQILGLDKHALAIEKKIWERLVTPLEEPPILPRVEPTEAGHRFYDREVEQILQCYKGKMGAS